MGRLEQSTRRGFAALTTPSKTIAWSLVAAGLVISWAVAVASGSTTAVTRHLFYLPIVLAAVRFGPGQTTLVALVAGVFAGPLAAVSEPVPLAVWGWRTVFFVLVGVAVGGLVALVRAAEAERHAIAEREQELVTQRALLIQTVSHEFRTPLTMIEGAVETLAARDGAVDPALRPVIDLLVRGSRRLDDLVAVVLAAAESVDGTLLAHDDEVVLRPLVADVAATLDHLDGRRRVRYREDASASRLFGHPAYLRLLLRIVIENALKFSPRDQPVHVHVRAAADGRIAITVEDRGDGIDPDFLTRAFDPFTQQDASTLRAQGGLGIGLFTAQRVVERLSGRIELHPRPGGGTAASVTLPRRPPRALQPGSSPDREG